MNRQASKTMFFGRRAFVFKAAHDAWSLPCHCASRYDARVGSAKEFLIHMNYEDDHGKQ